MNTGLLTCRVFKTHKQGESDADCQDSYCISEGRPAARGKPEANWRIAIADGATSSFFPAEWAERLATSFVQSFPNELLTAQGEANAKALDPWLESARSSWLQAVIEKAKHKPHYSVSNGLAEQRAGAATLLGVVVQPKIPAKWVAVAVGDSCLFHLCANQKATSFPLTAPEDFTNFVEALSSRQENNQRPTKVFRHDGSKSEGQISDGDVLILVTDALAKFLTERQQSGKPVWGTLLGLKDQAAFEAFVSAARRDGGGVMDNDDVTLVMLTAGAPHSHLEHALFTPTAGIEPSRRGSQSSAQSFTARPASILAAAQTPPLTTPGFIGAQKSSQTNPEDEDTPMTPQEKKHLFSQMRLLVISHMIMTLTVVVAATYLVMREPQKTEPVGEHGKNAAHSAEGSPPAIAKPKVKAEESPPASQKADLPPQKKSDLPQQGGDEKPSESSKTEEVSNKGKEPKK